MQVIIIHILVLIIQKINVCEIIFEDSSESLLSIKNLNIDSSINNVIIGIKNIAIVYNKSYVPYSEVDNILVYIGNKNTETT